MSLCTVAELRTALGVGTLYSDTVLQEVCNAADNVLLPFIWSNTYSVVAHENTGTTGRLYFDQYVDYIFYVGQTVKVDGCGAKYNGSKTVNLVRGNYIEITTTHLTDTPFHPVVPYGVVAADTYLDPADVPAIQEAALMVAVDIFQSRQAPAGGGVTVDGYAPSPYRMGNTLMGRIRGLLAPYLSPNSQVG